MNIEFKPLRESDFGAIKSIYEYYIEHTTVTYHIGEITVDELKDFIYTDHPLYLSYGIYIDNEMIGYTYFGPYKKRQAYERTAEITFYLKHEYTAKGIGQVVIEFMEERAHTIGLKNLLAVISADNIASAKLVERKGYNRCALFKNVGEKFGRLLDVAVYQKEI